jgi:hypothetical protein
MASDEPATRAYHDSLLQAHRGQRPQQPEIGSLDTGMSWLWRQQGTRHCLGNGFARIGLSAS